MTRSERIFAAFCCLLILAGIAMATLIVVLSESQPIIINQAWS